MELILFGLALPVLVVPLHLAMLASIARSHSMLFRFNNEHVCENLWQGASVYVGRGVGRCRLGSSSSDHGIEAL